MIHRLIHILLLLHYIQAGEPLSREKEDSTEVEGYVDVSSLEVPSADNRQQQELMGGKAMFERRRRHIGSIAAFRGLPGVFNKFNAIDWSAEDKDKMMLSNALTSPFGDVSKDKRYPEVIQMAMPRSNYRPANPVLLGHSAGHAIVTPPRNEARARAFNRLVRLLSEAKGNNPKAASTKKFLGQLARNNGLPAPSTKPKMLLPMVQYKGSMGIPLPGKRSNYDMMNENMEENALGEEWMEDGNGEEYADISEDEYNDQGGFPIKRHIGSLAKSGLLRPSRNNNFYRLM